MSIADEIRQRLTLLEPSRLAIQDESARHAGHVGAAGGGGHYRIEIVSPRFDGLSTIKRHRLVYDALGELMKRDIHALSMTTISSHES